MFRRLMCGLGQSGVQFCSLFGTTVPFPPEQIAGLYSNHDGFVSAWNGATQDAVNAGFIVKDDAEHIRVVAAQSTVAK
jgi:Alpha/beta hydrolase domain